MKIMSIASALILLSTITAAEAKPRYDSGNHWSPPAKHKVFKHGKAGKVTPWERRRISASRAQLVSLQRAVWADGRITPFERIKLNRAQRQHASLVQRLTRR